MAKIKGTAIRGALKFVKESGHPGGIAAVLAIQAGASESNCRKTLCVHRGDPHCEYQGEWTSKT